MNWSSFTKAVSIKHNLTVVLNTKALHMCWQASQCTCAGCQQPQTDRRGGTSRACNLIGVQVFVRPQFSNAAILPADIVFSNRHVLRFGKELAATDARPILVRNEGKHVYKGLPF